MCGIDELKFCHSVQSFFTLKTLNMDSFLFSIVNHRSNNFHHCFLVLICARKNYLFYEGFFLHKIQTENFCPCGLNGSSNLWLSCHLYLPLSLVLGCATIAVAVYLMYTLLATHIMPV